MNLILQWFLVLLVIFVAKDLHKSIIWIGTRLFIQVKGIIHAKKKDVASLLNRGGILVLIARSRRDRIEIPKKLAASMKVKWPADEP